MAYENEVLAAVEVLEAGSGTEAAKTAIKTALDYDGKTADEQAALDDVIPTILDRASKKVDRDAALARREAAFDREERAARTKQDAGVQRQFGRNDIV